MQTFKAFLLACAATIASADALAAGPKPEPGEVAVSVQKTVVIELVVQGDGKLVPVVLAAASGDRPRVSFSLSKTGSQRMLKVENKYDKALTYKARICFTNRKLCADTSVLQIPPGLSGFESWGDPIDRIVLSGFVLE